MAALNLKDLNNAKLDVDHIAAIATSEKVAVADRHGNTKYTVKGAINSLMAFNVRGGFSSGTQYVMKDVYTSGGVAYVAVRDHISTTVDADLAAGKVTVHQGATREELAEAGADTIAGAARIGFIQRGVGAVGQSVLEVLRERVTITQFGAKGDWDGSSGTDDTDAIQAAIDAVSAMGGGEVLVPLSRKFRFTRTLRPRANVILRGAALPGFYYPAAGSRLIADFANPNAWAIESDTYNPNNGARVDYRSGISGIEIDNGDYVRNENCGVRDLYIEVPGDNLYGGVRLMGCPGAIVENVGVERADIGFFFSACWGGKFRRLWSLTHLYGAAYAYDVNAAEISGYHVPVSGSAKSITAANRPEWVNPGDIGPAVETRDFKDEKIGLLLYFTNALHLTQVTTESWQMGRAYIAAKATVDDSVYSEANTGSTLAVISSDVVINGLKNVDVCAGNFYEFGVGAVVTMNNAAAKSANVSQYSRVSVMSADPDADGWKWSDHLRFPSADIGRFRVSSTGSASNIGTTSNYTTLDEALRRISLSKRKAWTVVIKDGDTVPLSSTVTLIDKNVRFVRESNGGNPIFRFTVAGGYPRTLTVGGDTALTFENVNVDYTAATSPGESIDAGGIRTQDGAATNLNLMLRNSTVSLQTAWALIQQGYASSSNINAAFQGGALSGSGTARVHSGAYNNEASANVICRQYGTAVDASIKAVGTNGWVGANVIASNF